MTTTPVKIPCQAVLFDMDGVLVDSTVIIERSWRKWAVHHSIDQEQLMELIHGRTAMDTIRMVAPHLDAYKEWQVLIRQELEDQEGPKSFAGVAALLRALPTGKWAIVTSAPRSIAVDRLERLGLLVPEILICADDITSGKPSPQGYQKAANALKVPHDKCVVIEDALPGIEAGLAAGMQVVAVASTHPVDELGAATWVIKEISQLGVESGGGMVLTF